MIKLSRLETSKILPTHLYLLTPVLVGCTLNLIQATNTLLYKIILMELRVKVHLQFLPLLMNVMNSSISVGRNLPDGAEKHISTNK